MRSILASRSNCRATGTSPTRTIALPFFNRLGEREVVRVKDALAEFFAGR